MREECDRCCQEHTKLFEGARHFGPQKESFNIEHWNFDESSIFAQVSSRFGTAASLRSSRLVVSALAPAGSTALTASSITRVGTPPSPLSPAINTSTASLSSGLLTRLRDKNRTSNQ